VVSATTVLMSMTIAKSAIVRMCSLSNHYDRRLDAYFLSS
jgi:hypothetical protein